MTSETVGFDETQHRDLIEELSESLRQDGLDLIDRHAIDAQIKDLDNCRPPKTINYIPPAVRDRHDEIIAIAGSEGGHMYNRLLLLTLISQFDIRAKACSLPEWLLDDVRDFLNKIKKSLEKPKTGYSFCFSDWQFKSDLAVCRLKQWPCGAELIDTYSIVPRKWLLKGGLRRSIERSHFFAMHAGGTRPFFETHFDTRLKRHFSSDGFHQLYRSAARLLESAPAIKGLISQSWWHDPAVATISPNLAFLNELPLSGGAKIFDRANNVDVTHQATRLSKERTEACREGRYRPSTHMMVWSRKKLMDWAKTQDA